MLMGTGIWSKNAWNSAVVVVVEHCQHAKNTGSHILFFKKIIFALEVQS